MKYGDYFEVESVPRWSLHNIDYNSLKQQIKTHTNKNQATTAIAIPGQTDHALKKFEDGFYLELCRQHDRVELFVASKADEINRRLRHLNGLVHTLLLKCTDSRGISFKKQRRFAKYQQQIIDCGNEIGDLERFVQAQLVAFQKILKKYKKWTGSTTLSSRFVENVLSNPKSFTRRDFHALQLEYRQLNTTLQAASPGIDTPTDARSNGPSFRRESRRFSQTPTLYQQQPEAPPQTYWNEYENGSEAGDDVGYAIYINPDDSESFPGMDKLRSVFTLPVSTIRSIFSRSSTKDEERQSLLQNSHRSSTDYFSTAHITDNEATDVDDASSAEFIASGYAAHYAFLPSIEEQRAERDREKILHRTAILSFVLAIVFVIIAGVLVATGRHTSRLEEDAGVTHGGCQFVLRLHGLGRYAIPPRFVPYNSVDSVCGDSCAKWHTARSCGG